MPPAQAKENPLHNFLLNVLLPVVALSVLSKEGDKPWHIGPVWGMIIAVAMPLAYGIWFFARTRKANAFSIIGLASVALTGGITLLAWRPDGSIHPDAAHMFALKEASIPFILGLCVILSHRTNTPLVRVFLFNPDIFDVARIEQALERQGRAAAVRCHALARRAGFRRLFPRLHGVELFPVALFPRRGRYGGGERAGNVQ